MNPFNLVRRREPDRPTPPPAPAPEPASPTIASWGLLDRESYHAALIADENWAQAPGIYYWRKSRVALSCETPVPSVSSVILRPGLYQVRTSSDLGIYRVTGATRHPVHPNVTGQIPVKTEGGYSVHMRPGYHLLIRVGED